MRKTSILYILLLFGLTACGWRLSTPEQREGDQDLLAVDAVQAEVAMVGPAPHISVLVSATLPDGCTLWEKREGAVQQHQEENIFYIDVYVTHLTSAECALGPQPLELGIGLDYTSLPAGDYFVNVNGVMAQFSISPEQAFDQNTAEQIEMVVAAVRADLTALGVTEFDILSVEPMLWNDSCLHMAEQDEICRDVITPGYLVVAGDGARSWEYHTNQDGSQLRVAAP